MFCLYQLRMQCSVCVYVYMFVCDVVRLCSCRWFVMKVGAAEQDRRSVMNHSCCTVLANTESIVGAGTVEWLFTLPLYSVQYFSHPSLSPAHTFSDSSPSDSELQSCRYPWCLTSLTWHMVLCFFFFFSPCFILPSLSPFLSRTSPCPPCIPLSRSLIFSGFSGFSSARWLSSGCLWG